MMGFHIGPAKDKIDHIGPDLSSLVVGPAKNSHDGIGPALESLDVGPAKQNCHIGPDPNQM
jgi:hypothetical protein